MAPPVVLAKTQRKHTHKKKIIIIIKKKLYDIEKFSYLGVLGTTCVEWTNISNLATQQK